MAKKDYSKSDNRTFTISLVASIVTALLILGTELILDVANLFGTAESKLPPLIIKGTIFVILLMVARHKWKEYDKEDRVR